MQNVTATQWVLCFNEAACNTGGTPASGDRLQGRNERCFNEAACNTGGTLGCCWRCRTTARSLQ